jgi:hypothetical protein
MASRLRWLSRRARLYSPEHVCTCRAVCSPLILVLHLAQHQVPHLHNCEPALLLSRVCCVCCRSTVVAYSHALRSFVAQLVLVSLVLLAC